MDDWQFRMGGKGVEVLAITESHAQVAVLALSL